MVYYSENIQIKKINKVVRCIRQGPGETRHKLLVVLSSGVVRTAHLTHPVTMCNKTYRVLSTRKAHLNLGVLIGDQSHRHKAHM